MALEVELLATFDRHLFCGGDLVVALVAVLRRTVIIEIVKTGHPEIPEQNRTVFLIVKLIGVAVLGIAVFFSVIVARSFSHP